MYKRETRFRNNLGSKVLETMKNTAADDQHVLRCDTHDNYWRLVAKKPSISSGGCRNVKGYLVLLTLAKHSNIMQRVKFAQTALDVSITVKVHEGFLR